MEPTKTPKQLFENQTTDGVSETYTCGSNPYPTRFIALQFTGVLGDATITIEKQSSDLNFYSTGDVIDKDSIYPVLLRQVSMTGIFRLNLENAGNGTDVTCDMSFMDTADAPTN
tara:strand:- start:255 stop:596 length:342 start_codon:yes stop_codon:yes gene_type:complete